MLLSEYVLDASSDSATDTILLCQEREQLHAYLSAHSSMQITEALKDEFDFFINLVDRYSQVRAYAESFCNSDTINRNKALPLSWENVYTHLYDMDNSIPPQRQITVIAQRYVRNIDVVLNNLHKVLHRKRSKIFLGKAQQIDAQCIRWLTRQPGYTVGQKAGDRQKVLAVIREETVDTVENRVVKAFLQLCRNECERYIDLVTKLARKRPSLLNHERVIAVRKLLSICQYYLSMSYFETISELRGLPHPNYILQNNPNYRCIWQQYVLLLKKTKLVETIWEHRTAFLSDILELAIFSFYGYKLREPIWHRMFFSEVWLFPQPQQKTLIYHSKYFEEKIAFTGRGIVSIARQGAEWSIRYNNKVIDSLVFCFIPSGKSCIEINRNGTMVICDVLTKLIPQCCNAERIDFGDDFFEKIFARLHTQYTSLLREIQ
ncbi:MAG: DUF2357 domain-containing protein [Spirochaetia bacterium]|jgi:hypothetical protein|nr:DUF2357 domain-containing protein [Spirochaetia bacterium]